MIEDDGPTFRFSGWVHLLSAGALAVSAAYLDGEMSVFLGLLSFACLIFWWAS